MYSMFKGYCTVSELGSCQSNLCNSRDYERLQKSKDSLKACFVNRENKVSSLPGKALGMLVDVTASDLGLHCLPMSHKKDARRI